MKYYENMPIMYGIEHMDIDYGTTPHNYIPTNTADIDYPADTECYTCSVPSRIVLPQSETEFTGSDDGGITDHSSDERYIIVAIDRQNKLGKQAFEYWLENNHIGFKAIMGKFAGEVQYSYVINARNWIKVRDSGFISRQAWILYLWPHAYGYVEFGVDARKATLYNARSGMPRELGVFVAINDDELINYDDWSFDTTTDTYYVTKTKEQLK